MTMINEDTLENYHKVAKVALNYTGWKAKSTDSPVEKLARDCAFAILAFYIDALSARGLLLKLQGELWRLRAALAPFFIADRTIAGHLRDEQRSDLAVMVEGARKIFETSVANDELNLVSKR